MDPGKIRETIGAFQNSRIILTAFELDIFTFLGKSKHSSESVSAALNLDKDATERLMNALVALGLLEKENESFRNTEESYAFLAKDSPEYMSGLMHTNHLWHTWSSLTDVVRSGKVAHREEINERGEEWLNAFIHAMHYRGKKQAPSQIATIDLEGVYSVLDIGGGSGCFVMEFMKRKPGLQGAIFDLPNVTPISRKIIAEEGFGGKVALHNGDYTTDELPQGFDLTFLSAIIHSNTYEMNQELVRKCYDALNPGGEIVIQDWIMNDDKTKPHRGAIFSINMLVGVDGGDCYSESEVSTWMRNAGFTGITKVDLEAGLGRMIGVKKA